MIFYTNRFVPEGAAGCARGLIILIRPEKKGDIGLLRHEEVHVKQSINGLLIVHALRYRFSKSYRLACEVEAYREQCRHYANDRRWLYAGFIAKSYDLAISQESAYVLLLAQQPSDLYVAPAVS